MATTETITVLRVDGKPAVTSLRELKAAIEADKDALVQLGLVEDSDTEKKEKQAAITKQLEQDLKLLNQVQNAAKVTTLQNAKAIDTSTASYYDMQKALTTLKKAWKEMTAEERNATEGTEILQKIKQLDAELKTLDSDIGQFQRNVGNYGQTFAQSLDQAQKGAMGLTQGLNSLNGIVALTGNSSDTLTKALAALSAVVLILNSGKGIKDFIEKLKSLKSATDATTQATNTASNATNASSAATSAATATTATATAETKVHTTAMEADAAATKGATLATNGFKKALLATGIGAVVVALGALIMYLDKLKKETEEAKEKMDNAFRKNLEKQIETIDKLVEKVKYFSSVLKATGKSDIETFDAEYHGLIELGHQYEKVWTDAVIKFGAASDEAKAAKAKMTEAFDAAGKAAKDARLEMEKWIAKWKNWDYAHTNMTQLERDIQSVHDKAKAMRESLDELVQAGALKPGVEYDYFLKQITLAEEAEIAALKKAAAKAAAEKLKSEKEAAKKILKEAQDAQKSESELITQKYKEDLAKLEKFHLDTTALTENYNKALAELGKKAKEARAKYEEAELAEALERRRREHEEEYELQLAAINRSEEVKLRQNAIEKKKEREREEESYEIQKEGLQKRLDALQEYYDWVSTHINSEEDYKLALSLQQEVADMSVEIELREAEEKARIRKRDKKNREQAAKETVASVSSVLGAIADIYESNGKEDAKAQKRAKNLRIAAATIDMLQGAVTAYATAQTLGPIAGPIVGAINAAAVTAAGLANIAKIRATDTSGNSAPNDSYSAPAVADAPQVNPEVQVVRNLTGQSEEDRINQPQRVYILQSDIEAAGNKSRAVVAESTF